MFSLISTVFTFSGIGNFAFPSDFFPVLLLEIVFMWQSPRSGFEKREILVLPSDQISFWDRVLLSKRSNRLSCKYLMHEILPFLSSIFLVMPSNLRAPFFSFFWRLLLFLIAAKRHSDSFAPSVLLKDVFFVVLASTFHEAHRLEEGDTGRFYQQHRGNRKIMRLINLIEYIGYRNLFNIEMTHSFFKNGRTQTKSIFYQSQKRNVYHFVAISLNLPK